MQVFGCSYTYFLVVNIAENNACRFKGFKLFYNLNGSYVTGVPDFIAVGEIFKYTFIQITVRV